MTVPRRTPDSPVDALALILGVDCDDCTDVERVRRIVNLALWFALTHDHHPSIHTCVHDVDMDA
jgi:hypothetical protein